MPETAWKLYKETTSPLFWGLALFYVFVIIANGLAFSTPYFLKEIADIALVVDYPDFTFHLVAIPVAIILLLLLCQEFFFRIAHYIEVVIVKTVRKVVDTRIFNSLLDSPTAYFEDKLSGRLAKRSNQVSTSIVYFVEDLPWEIGWVVMAVLSSAVLMFIAHPYLLLTFLIWLLLYLSVSYILLKHLYVVSALVAEKDAEYGGHYVDVVSNMHTVHSFGSTRFERKGFLFVLTKYVDVVKQEGMWTIWNKLQQGLSVVVLSFSLIICGVWLYGRGVIAVTDFILIAGIIPAMNGMVWNAGDMCLNLLRKLSDLINAVQELQSEYKPQKQGTSVIEFVNQDISFTNVNFLYPRTKEKVLDNLNVTFEAGKKVGIVGTSGAGKTTLVKLLLRHYDVDSGSISIGGKDIDETSLESLRQSISFVPQDTSLFHRSLFDNIQYAKPGASLREVMEVSKRSHAHEFIQSLPQKYDTMVGERGVKLSGGQRQRVAVARAMLKDASILVLDEATSALDGESEKVVQQGFSELFRDRTVIAIAHRLSTLREMDRIIVIEGGKIVEDGAPNDLLQMNNGIFKKKWEQQKDGFV